MNLYNPIFNFYAVQIKVSNIIGNQSNV